MKKLTKITVNDNNSTKEYNYEYTCSDVEILKFQLMVFESSFKERYTYWYEPSSEVSFAYVFPCNEECLTTYFLA